MDRFTYTPQTDMSTPRADGSGVKGDRVRIVGGSYRGCQAWLDRLGRTTASKIDVIVLLPSGAEKHVKLNKTSLARWKEPDNRIEAALFQHPDIEQDMNRLVAKLASCNINDGTIIRNIFGNKLQKAYMRHGGSDAEFARNVDYRYSF